MHLSVCICSFRWSTRKQTLVSSYGTSDLLHFWGICVPPSPSAKLSYTPIVCAQTCPFGISPAVLTACPCDSSYSDRVEVPCHWFGMNYPNDYFHMSIGCLGVFFGQMSMLGSLPIFNGLLTSCMISFYIWTINSFIRYMICKYLLQFDRLPFCFIGGCHCYKDFYFDEFPIFWGGAVSIGLGSRSKQIITKTDVKELSACFRCFVQVLSSFWIVFGIGLTGLILKTLLTDEVLLSPLNLFKSQIIWWITYSLILFSGYIYSLLNSFLGKSFSLIFCANNKWDCFHSSSELFTVSMTALDAFSFFALPNCSG